MLSGDRRTTREFIKGVGESIWFWLFIIILQNFIESLTKKENIMASIANKKLSDRPPFQTYADILENDDVPSPDFLKEGPNPEIEIKPISTSDFTNRVQLTNLSASLIFASGKPCFIFS